METALYLLPVTLGDTAIDKVLPAYNAGIIREIKHFIVEDVRSARRFLKKVDREIDIDTLSLSAEQAYFTGRYFGISESFGGRSFHGRDFRGWLSGRS